LAATKERLELQVIAASFEVGTTTAWRYVNETVTLLAARSPKLSRALAKAKKDGLTLILTPARSFLVGVVRSPDSGRGRPGSFGMVTAHVVPFAADHPS
jgi:hypothetical protein